MLKIRLSRGGAKKRPFYKVVLADARSPRDGRFIERLGHFDPMLPRENENRVKIDLERVKYWLSKGAQPTDRLQRMLAEAGIMKAPAHNGPSKSAPRKKAQERMAAEAKAAADAAAAAS
ncbi:MAG TPA: 30S ribosomal protein S16 [Alphaproteobacteria bacterium]|nr:30S ribosomal protein S16 [Alphaproteobacteria bacterium]